MGNYDCISLNPVEQMQHCGHGRGPEESLAHLKYLAGKQPIFSRVTPPVKWFLNDVLSATIYSS